MNSDNTHRRDNLISVFVMLEPADYWPPSMPKIITDDLRKTWFAYVRLWSDLRAPEGVEPCEDVLGSLWALYRELQSLGVQFDPNFDGEMSEMARLAYNIDPDGGHDADDVPGYGLN